MAYADRLRSMSDLCENIRMVDNPLLTYGDLCTYVLNRTDKASCIKCTNTLCSYYKWSEIKKCEVNYKPMNAGFSFRSRYLFIIAQSSGKSSQHIFVSLSGKYCRNKGVIEAVKRFVGIDVFDSQSSHHQNKYLVGIFLGALIGIALIFAISMIKET